MADWNTGSNPAQTQHASTRRMNRMLLAVIGVLVIFLFSAWASSALDLSHMKDAVVDVTKKVGGGKPAEIDWAAPNHDPLGDKIIVMAHRESEDVSWVGEYLGDWQRALYSVDNTSAPLHVSLNKGREANVYLEYLITHYDHLPEIIAFIHAHHKGVDKGWHVDALEYDNVYGMNKLKLDYIRKNGYANLRCRWAPGCPDEIQPFRDHGDMQIETMLDKKYLCESQIRRVWPEIFPGIETPKLIAAPCCAQFAVTRDQVHKRPIEDYMHFHKWLKETDINEYDLGRIFEYLWHIIFGQDYVYCPEESICLNNVYGGPY